MRVVLSRRAEITIWEIWDWNEGRFGPTHADRYTDALREHVLGIPENLPQCRPIGADPSRRIPIFQRGRGKYGHIIVFGVEADTIRITGIYHSAQDWRTKLEGL